MLFIYTFVPSVINVFFPFNRRIIPCSEAKFLHLMKLFLLSSEISSSEKPLNLENSIVCGVSMARFSISLNNSGFSESKFNPSASITSLIVSPFVFFLYCNSFFIICKEFSDFPIPGPIVITSEFIATSSIFLKLFSIFLFSISSIIDSGEEEIFPEKVLS